GDDRLGLSKVCVNLLEAHQKARHGSRTDGDVGPNTDVPLSPFAGDYTKPLLCCRIFHPEKILRQQLTEAPMNLLDSFRLAGQTTFQSATVDPLLHCNMGFRFLLQVALVRVL